MSTNLFESKTNLPPLAQYKPRAEYIPQYGDYIIWSGWITTWHGLIVDYDKDTNKIHALMAGVPYLLFTMAPTDFAKETVEINLDQIKRAPNGKFAIQHHDQTQNAIIWYV